MKRGIMRSRLKYLAVLAILPTGLMLGCSNGTPQAVQTGDAVTSTTTITTTTTTTTTTTMPPTTTTTMPPTTTTTEPPAVQSAAESAPAVVQPAPRGDWYNLVAAHFGSEADFAYRVMMCESNGNPNAVSPTNDHGLFQINEPSNRKMFEQQMGVPFYPNVYDPNLNVAYASWLRREVGWQAWSCA